MAFRGTLRLSEHIGLVVVLAAMMVAGIQGRALGYSIGESTGVGAADCGIERSSAALLTEAEYNCIGEPWATKIRELAESDPVADADREAAEGDFRLLKVSVSLGADYVPHAVCVIDYPKEMLRDVFLTFDVGFGVGGDVLVRHQLRYLRTFNQRILSHRDYPFGDVCREGKNRTENGSGGTNYLAIGDWKRSWSKGKKDGTLATAARRGRFAEVRALLKNGADVNEFDTWGTTPLGWAALRGDPRLVEMLLKNGADPNRHLPSKFVAAESTITSWIFEDQPTILNRAILSGNPAVVDALISSGADVNRWGRSVRQGGGFMSQSDGYLIGGTPLTMSFKRGNKPIVQLLIASGANVNEGAREWPTPISSAIKNGRFDILPDLIGAGASVAGRKTDEVSPVQFAAEVGSYRAISTLLSAGAAVDARSDIEREAWLTAHRLLRREILIELVSFGANLNLLSEAEQAGLHLAIRRNELERVEELIELANSRAEELGTLISKGDLKGVQAVFSNGANISEGRKRTALLQAILEDQKEILEWLLTNGADPDAPFGLGNFVWVGDENWRPGHPRTFFEWSRYELAKRLDPGQSALQLSFKHGPKSTVNELLRYSTEVQSNPPGAYESVLGYSLSGYENHQDVSLVDLALLVGGSSQRHGPESDQFLSDICAMADDPEVNVLKHFLEQGFRPRQIGEDDFLSGKYRWDRRALASCLSHGPLHALAVLQGGADPNQRDQYGQLPLEKAIDYLFGQNLDALTLIEQLMSMGADPNVRGVFGQFPLDQVDQAIERIQNTERLGNWRADIFKSAKVILVKFGAKTRAELEVDGLAEPRPEYVPVVPVR